MNASFRVAVASSLLLAFAAGCGTERLPAPQAPPRELPAVDVPDEPPAPGTTRVVLEEVVGMVDGVAHVEVDAESHLDLVRRLDVRRTPTVLVLDSAGLVRVRAAGAPRKADVIAALGQVV